jgi:FkbM family methyltransferase
MSCHVERCNQGRNARLHLLNVALGSQHGMVSFCRNSSCLSRVARDADDASRCIQVRMETLDEVVTSQKIEHIDLIKMDVEGFELEVLKGATARALRLADRVVMQYHEGSLKEVTELLRKQGFQPAWQNDEKAVAMFEKADFKAA